MSPPSIFVLGFRVKRYGSTQPRGASLPVWFFKSIVNPKKSSFVGDLDVQCFFHAV